MLKPRKDTDFCYLVIYLKETEPGLCSVACESSYYLGKDGNMEKKYLVWEPIYDIFFIYAGIADNTSWEKTCSKQTVKTLSKCQNKYRNIKSTITMSKA